MPEKIDLSFFAEPPSLRESGSLKIAPLGPLSMTVGQGGNYYQSAASPSRSMLYGMVENALGWHFSAEERKSILEGLRKEAERRLGHGSELKETEWIQGPQDRSPRGFQSLLAHHLKFEGFSFVPDVERFEDLWSRHVYDTDSRFIGGSLRHGKDAERVLRMLEEEKIERAKSLEKADVSTPEALGEVEEGDKVHANAFRGAMPLHHSSPTTREYVIPQGAYRFAFRATQAVLTLLEEGLGDPAAPLYLGTSEGWVDADLILPEDKSKSGSEEKAEADPVG